MWLARTDDEPGANAEISDDERRRTHGVVPHRRRALRQRGLPTMQVSGQPCGIFVKQDRVQQVSWLELQLLPRRRAATFP